MNLKLYITTGLLIFSHFLLLSQENLITNPDFLSNTSSWVSSGNSTLSYITNGALTAGSAHLLVNQAGNISSAELSTTLINIPSGTSAKMHYLSLYARTDNATNTLFRIRIDFVDINGNEHNQTSEDLILTNSFKDFSIPVYVAEGILSMQIHFQCGEQAGSYFFDDVTFILAETTTDNIQQFDHWQPRQFATPVITQNQNLDSGTADVQLTLNTSDIIAPVLSTQFGVNSNFRSGNDLLNRTDLYQPFGSFRFPAGSGSDEYFWDCNIPGAFELDLGGICGTSNSKLSPENFINFKDDANGEATVVINYMYARYGITAAGTREARVQQAADYAAEWVNYFNNELNANVKYWEIGNECYGPWETGNDVNGSILTGKEYGEDFRIFVEAMKAVDENIRIGAVLWHKKFEWNNQVLKEVKDDADFLIVHHYFHLNDAQSAADALLEIKKDMQEIQAAASYNTGKADGYFPVAFTEFNIQDEPASTIINGLFVAEALANMIKNRFFLSTIWVNEWNLNNENHSKGLLAQNDSGQGDYTPRPAYTPFYFYDKYFGDQMIAVTAAGSDEVRAYASTFSSGETGIVLINYSNTTKKVSLNFTDNSISANRIYWHSVHAENDNSTNRKFFVNETSSTTLNGGPDLDQVAAFTATYSEDNYLNIPKFSATYLVLNTNIITQTEDTGDTSLEILFPNPTNGMVFIKNTKNVGTDFQVLNIEGKSMKAMVSVVENNGLYLTLDCSQLTRGVYFLKLGDKVFKFCKQ